MIELVTEYDGGISPYMDEAIRQIVGIEPIHTGQWMLEPFTRDMRFDFGIDLPGAERAQAYVTSVPGVRVRLYDDSRESDSE